MLVDGINQATLLGSPLEVAAEAVGELGVDLLPVDDDLGGRVFSAVPVPDPAIEDDVRNRIMGKVGWLYNGGHAGRSVLAPDVVRFANGMGKVGVNLAFWGGVTERGLTPFEDNLKSWDSGRYPVGYATYKMLNHDVSADHAAPVVVGGEDFMGLIAPSLRYAPVQRAKLYDRGSSVISRALSFGHNGSSQNLEQAAAQVAKSLNRVNIKPGAVDKRTRKIVDSIESGMERLNLLS